MVDVFSGIINDIRTKNIKWFAIITVIVAMVATSLSLGVSTVSASDDGAKDYSMYYRAAEVATAFGMEMAPSEDGGKSTWLNGLTLGNAGGLLGYSRDLKEDEDGIMGWVTSDFSANTVTYNFDQLESMGGGSISSGSSNGLFAYGLYGAQLQELGLVDSKVPGFINNVVGLLFLVAYWFAQAVPMIFELMMDIISMLNPFQLFHGAIDGLAGTNVGIFSDLAKRVSEIYQIVQDLSMFVLIPVFIGLTMVSIFMFQGNTGKKLMRVFIRIFMIFAGLPIIGATYTGIVDQMAGGLEMSTPFADYVVATQFVDTEGWIKSSRLAPPAISDFMAPNIAGANDADYNFASAVSRDHVYKINSTRVEAGRGLAAIDNLSGSIFDTDMADEANAGQLISYKRFGGSLLNRYVNGTRFAAADYEGFVKSQLDEDPSISEHIKPMFEMEVDDLTDDDNKGLFKVGGDTTLENALSIYNMGGLDLVNTRDDGFLSYKLDGINSGVDGSASNTSFVKSSSVGADVSTPIGLSPLSMYNFLNTEFTRNSLTVYSPKQSSSMYTANDYASVSRANRGFIGFIYATESIVLLVVSALVGFMYAIGLLKIVMSSLPQILTSVFGTAMGSMAMITKLLVSTVVLIVEIIGTITLYMMFDSILLSIFKGSSELLGKYAQGGVLYTAETMGSLLTIVMGIGVGFFAITNRTKFAKMVEEVSTDIITKLMGGLDNNLNQGTLMHNAGDVGAGAQAGTVLGADGTVGSEGSGIYDSKVKGGGNPAADAEDKKASSILGSVGRARKEAQHEAGVTGEEMKSNKDIAKDAASKYAKGKKARGMDKLAAGMGGGLATALTMAGVSDLDGGAKDRLQQEEDLKMQNIREQQRAAAYGGDDNDGSDGVGEETITTDPDGAKSTEEFAKDMDAIDAMSTNDILSDESDNEFIDHIDSDDDADELPIGNTEFGSVAESAEAEDTDVYGDMDRTADEQMADAFGDDAESVSLDDPTDHISADPMSDEYGDYINDVSEASDEQRKVAEEHTNKADRINGEISDLENDIDDLKLKEPQTDADRAAIASKESEVAGLRVDSENHRKQAVAATGKGDKLSAKSKDAQSKRTGAMDDSISNAQAKMVKASSEHTKNAAELGRLQSELATLDKDHADAYDAGDYDTADALAERRTSVASDVATAEKALEKSASALPVDKRAQKELGKEVYAEVQTEAAAKLSAMSDEAQDIPEVQDYYKASQAVAGTQSQIAKAQQTRKEQLSAGDQAGAQKTARAIENHKSDLDTQQSRLESASDKLVSVAGASSSESTDYNKSVSDLRNNESALTTAQAATKTAKAYGENSSRYKKAVETEQLATAKLNQSKAEVQGKASKLAQKSASITNNASDIVQKQDRMMQAETANHNRAKVAFASTASALEADRVQIVSDLTDASTNGASVATREKLNNDLKAVESDITENKKNAMKADAGYAIVKRGHSDNRKALKSHGPKAAVNQIQSESTRRKIAGSETGRREFNSRVRSKLAPKSAPRIDNPGSIRLQQSRLKALGLNEEKDVAAYYQKYNAPVIEMEETVANTEKKIKTAMRNNDVGSRKQQEAILKTQTAELNARKVRRTAVKDKLSKNISGMISDGKRELSQKGLTQPGKNMTGDVDRIVRTYQDLAEDQRKLGRLELDKSGVVTKTDLEKFRRKINKRKKALLAANMSPQSMANDEATTRSSQMLFDEIDSVITGNKSKSV